MCQQTGVGQTNTTGEKYNDTDNLHFSFNYFARGTKKLCRIARLVSSTHIILSHSNMNPKAKLQK